MNWLNIEISLIHSPEYVGSEPVERATWLNLMVYCASQENGGVITNCADWKCRRWQQTCGVTKDEIETESELWNIDEEGNLHVWAYPVSKENEVQSKREAGAKGGKNRAKNAALKPSLKQDDEGTSSTASSSPSSSASTERKGKEGNGKEERESADAPRSLSTNFPTDELSAEAIATIVNSCQPAWEASPILNPKEKAAVRANLDALRAIQPDSWQAIRLYLAAKIPEGMPKYQPKSRLKFIEDTSDVLNYALQWYRNHGPKPKAPPKPKEEPEGEPCTPEDIANFFKKPLHQTAV